MASKKSAVKTVTKFACELKKHGIKLRHVFLFGSYAENRQHQWSDIDVALVADNFVNFGFEDMKQFVSILLKKDYSNIQPRTYSTAYFKKGDPFINEVIKSGLEIKF